MPSIRSNRTMWRAIKSLVFCLGLVLALVAVSFVSKPSIGSVDPWPAVRETSGQVDVLAMGSSRTYCTVMPMEMWRESGVTALDVTSGTQPMSLTYEYLRQSLTQQHPKVVLLELYMMGRADSFTLQRAHTNLDYMPMGVPRAAGILESTPPSEWLELFVPLVTYHSRWAELTRDDYQWDKYSRSTYARGASYISGVASIPVNPPPSDIALSAYTDDLAYVRKIARLCADNDAQLVLFTSPSPHVMWVDGQPMLLRLQNDLTAEYPDTRYLDMNSLIEPIGLDPNTDYKDELHLNHRGAVKVSKWLATTLAREFQLPDRRSESLADKWNSSLAQYDKVFTSKK